MVTRYTACAGRPPKASAEVCASGVTPTMWNNATAPVDAAAAPNALS